MFDFIRVVITAISRVAAKIPLETASRFRFKNKKNNNKLGIAAMLINPLKLRVLYKSISEFFNEISVKKYTTKTKVKRGVSIPKISPKLKELIFKSPTYLVVESHDEP